MSSITVAQAGHEAGFNIEESDTHRFIKSSMSALQFDGLARELGCTEYRLTWLMNNRPKWRMQEVYRLGVLIGIEPVVLVLEYGFGRSELTVDDLQSMAEMRDVSVAILPAAGEGEQFDTYQEVY